MKHTTKRTKAEPGLMARLTGGRHGKVKKTTIIETTESQRPRRAVASYKPAAGHNPIGRHQPVFGHKTSGWTKLKRSLTGEPGVKKTKPRKQRALFGRKKLHRI